MSIKLLRRLPGIWQNVCANCCKNNVQNRVFISTTQGLAQRVPTEADDVSTSTIIPTSSLAKRSLPLMTSRKLGFPSVKPSKQAWLETLSQTEDEKLGILDLHPDVFGVFPRIDVLWWNVFWQQKFRKIDYFTLPNRAELPGGGRKPWPQKGTGRARHGSVRSPLWHKGGKSHGPRGPKSYFFMAPDNLRVLGLRTALTVKYAQENLHIVDSFDLPDDDPKYLENLVESRGWGLSVLFVDDTDIIPRNMALAVDGIKQYNAMPVYGLNVYSLLKHETLVLTIDALNKLEEKLLSRIHNQDARDRKYQRFPASL